MSRWPAALLLALAAPAALAGFTAQVCSVGVPGERQAGVDDDVDGVPDSDDWCMGTPAGTRVGANGCADWEVPVDCPKPPAPATAPATAEAAPAAAPGPDPAAAAAEIEKVVLKGVSFEMGSHNLLPAAHAPLRSIAAAMKAHPALRVEVRGHTDSIGTQQRNARLSQRRAESVRAFLVGEGVDAARLTAKGYGESEPVESNETPEGRANNRRVEFKVTNGD